MCGIFGLLVGPKGKLDCRGTREISDSLFRLSASRGKEASGFCFFQNGLIEIHRYAVSSSELIKKSEYKAQFTRRQNRVEKKAPAFPFALIGHSRLATSGSYGVNQNNQPINTGWVIGVHNGVISNYQSLLTEYPDLACKTDNDSEVVFRLFEKNYKKSNSLAEAVTELFEQIEDFQ